MEYECYFVSSFERNLNINGEVSVWVRAVETRLCSSYIRGVTIGADRVYCWSYINSICNVT
jgi:hypothetical protein